MTTILTAVAPEMLAEYIDELEIDAAAAGWQRTHGVLAAVLTPQNLAKPLTTSGFARIWAAVQETHIVGLACLFDVQNDEGLNLVNGVIYVDHDKRGTGLADVLQAARLGFCDAHDLVFYGDIDKNNHWSMKFCSRWGFKPLEVADNGNTLRVVRWPVEC